MASFQSKRIRPGLLLSYPNLSVPVIEMLACLYIGLFNLTIENATPLPFVVPTDLDGLDEVENASFSPPMNLNASDEIGDVSPPPFVVPTDEGSPGYEPSNKRSRFPAPTSITLQLIFLENGRTRGSARGHEKSLRSPYKCHPPVLRSLGSISMSVAKVHMS
jgi:hypothetical protein